MKHPDFVTWMLLFPLVSSLSDWIRLKYEERQFDDSTKAGAAIILITIWFSIGALLF